MEEQLTRRQRRLLKKQERERQLSKEQRRSRIHGKHVVGLIILVGLIGVGVYGVSRLGTTATSNAPPTQTYTPGPVHWHAKVDLSVCGEKRDLPGPQDGSAVGGHFLHHHGDGTLHVEGRVIEKADISLGKFADAIGLVFDRDKLLDKKNGDECAPGKPGSVKMFVNGEPNTEFRDFVGQYTPEAKDNVIRIVFE